MATPFNRTMRAIQADYLPLFVGAAAFAGIFIVGWLVWFMSARVSFYDSSTGTQILEDGTIYATFVGATVQRLHEGQSAYLQLTGNEGRTQTIDARILELDRETNLVTLIPVVDVSFYGQLMSAKTLNVTVVIDQVSPLSLLLRAAGLSSANG